MTTEEDFIINLFCRVDEQMKDVPQHSQAALWPSEVVTIGILCALKGVGTRTFYRWSSHNPADWFPRLPERTRLYSPPEYPMAVDFAVPGPALLAGGASFWCGAAQCGYFLSRPLLYPLILHNMEESIWNCSSPPLQPTTPWRVICRSSPTGLSAPSRWPAASPPAFKPKSGIFAETAPVNGVGSVCDYWPHGGVRDPPGSAQAGGVGARVLFKQQRGARETKESGGAVTLQFSLAETPRVEACRVGTSRTGCHGMTRFRRLLLNALHATGNRSIRPVVAVLEVCLHGAVFAGNPALELPKTGLAASELAIVVNENDPLSTPIAEA